MLFLTKPHLSVFVPVTCIFAESGTYHLPRNSCEFQLMRGEVVSSCFSLQSCIFLVL